MMKDNEIPNIPNEFPDPQPQEAPYVPETPEPMLPDQPEPEPKEPIDQHKHCHFP